MRKGCEYIIKNKNVNKYEDDKNEFRNDCCGSDSEPHQSDTDWVDENFLVVLEMNVLLW